MNRIVSHIRYFTLAERVLWCTSVLLTVISFVLFDRSNYLTLTASLLGVTSLIYNAKGNPVGQLLMIVFSIMYGTISYTYAYYGEMITYLGMTAPMALFALVSWLRHPYQGNKAEVQVNSITATEGIFVAMLTAVVTYIFYYIMLYFNTANMLPSTISVSTSFAAVYLTFRRSPLYAVAYAANDIVLIVLWVMASVTDAAYISVVICFVMFLANDIYGYINWRKMKKRQA